MVNPIYNASQAARRAQKTLAGRWVALTRGSISVEVYVTFGETQTETHDGNGAIIDSRFRDVLVDACDYDFGDGPVDPQRGDLFTYTIGGDRDIKLEAVPIQINQSDARLSDRDGETWRVHTQERKA